MAGEAHANIDAISSLFVRGEEEFVLRLARWNGSPRPVRHREGMNK
jgi:hypothetical protein